MHDFEAEPGTRMLYFSDTSSLRPRDLSQRRSTSKLYKGPPRKLPNHNRAILPSLIFLSIVSVGSLLLTIPRLHADHNQLLLLYLQPLIPTCLMAILFAINVRHFGKPRKKSH